MKTKSIWHGVVGGLAGGTVFGMMMAMMGMLPMIGKMAGQPTAVAGFAVHLGISAMIGGSFALLAGPLVRSARSGLVTGVVYGAFWWVLGPLILMPGMMGMGYGAGLNAAAAVAALPSLMGHMLYGAILGLVYRALSRRAASCGSTCRVPTMRAV